MEVRNYFCDVCKKQVNEGKDLKTISIGNGGDYVSYSSYNRFEVYKKFDLCVECQTKIGLNLSPKPERAEIETVENKLFDAVVNIVEEAINTRRT